MTKEARISSISFSSYPADTITVAITTDGAYSSFAFKDAECQKILALVWELIQKRKGAFAEAILSIQTPVAIAAGASGDMKLIEAEKDDELPF